LEHITDSTSSLNDFTSYQDSQIETLSNNTKSELGDANNAIADANNEISQTQSGLATVSTETNNLQNQTSSLQSQTSNLQNQTSSLQNQTNSLTSQTTQLSSQLKNVSQTAAGTQTALTALTATVNSLPTGLQITPSVSSNTISLSINSSIAQTVALEIVFVPTADMPQLATMDTSLAALYSAPPVSLTAGSSVRGDYTLYWDTSNNVYDLGMINFLTNSTSLTAGLNTKTITYSTSGTYQILITPEYTTGTGSW
jgi:uncharacterized phage infection (PIP) family protein YhgE